MIELGATAGSITNDLVLSALDIASKRHAAIAVNVANANTEGFRPLHVDFEQQIALHKQQLLQRANDQSSRPLLQAMRNRPDSASYTTLATAERVQLDEEMAAMARNTLWYQALLAARDRAQSIIGIAIHGGRS